MSSKMLQYDVAIICYSAATSACGAKMCQVAEGPQAQQPSTKAQDPMCTGRGRELHPEAGEPPIPPLGIKHISTPQNFCKIID